MPMTELHSTTPELDPRLTSLAEGFAALTEDIDALVAQRDELLAALKALVDEVELKDNPIDYGADRDCDQMERARAAIARAEGAK